MADEISGRNRRYTVFPGSDPNVLPKKLTPPRETHVINETIPRKEKPTAHIGTFTSGPTSYDVANKHTSRDRLENRWTPSFTSPVPEKRPSRDEIDYYFSDSAHKGEGEVAASKRTRVEHRIRTSRELTYHEFMDLGQAGPAIMGFDNTREANLVAIKRLERIGKRSMRGMRPFTSDSVVNIRDMYFDNNDLVIIYEPMHISLRQITGILQDPFKPFQIAAICKEVIDGLSFIHEELSLHHGDLSCGTIVLNLDGMIKIANIGESFARERYITTESKREDICSIGFVMVELMEPTTYMLNPRSTELQSPEIWKDGSGITDFLYATQHKSLEELKNYHFLKKEPIAKCLIAHVFCAMFAAKTDWNIRSLP